MESHNLAADIDAAMHAIADDLCYPVDHRGRIYDVRFLIPQISFHLARAGYRKHTDLAVIKKRRLPPTPGVVEDAVEWVHPDAADSIEDELAGASIADAARLSPAARAELIRRLGGNPDPVAATQPDLDERVPWRTETHIQFDNEESTSGTNR